MTVSYLCPYQLFFFYGRLKVLFTASLFISLRSFILVISGGLHEWSNEIKTTQYLSTLLGIRTLFGNAVIWMASILLRILWSFNLFIRLFRSIQSIQVGPVIWGSRIHWLHLRREVRLPQRVSGPVDNSSRIHWLHHYRGLRLLLRVSDQVGWSGVKLPQRVSWYDTKQSYAEISVMQELWAMWSTPLLSSLPGSLWPGVVALDRVLYMGQTELNCVSTLNWIVWN